MNKKKFKLLFTSYYFWPHIGGMETFAQVLAQELAKKDLFISVLTSTPHVGKEQFPYQVIRTINPFNILLVTFNADVILHNHLSIKLCWASALLNKPYGIIIQNWLSFKGIKGIFHKWILKKAKITVGVSQAIVDHLPYKAKTIVIPNLFDDSLFSLPKEENRPKDLLFVGRMVSGKGAIDVLKALMLLKQEKIDLTASFVGYGPEEENLMAFIKANDLEQRVDILGPKTQQEVADLMKNHKILVVPSIYDEPFGIVALEGIASGCVVIGSERGGLKEAIGPCGLTYPNGDVYLLASKIKEVIKNPELFHSLRFHAKEHLKKYTRKTIGENYYNVLQKILFEKSTV
ncbi:glycosyltransferase family 1 protein [Candidatus Methylacidiphilum fumarolicum]|uniref:Glycosyl transferase family 1 domain-containing protein n=2 Tax=Candidatus Methylacidiphilum fumarolicum TaxID=591154 RepID=I0JYD1_METFB|nr:glycosyltransferase family 4 protein [Candidatus Methylacidiphilum fumarolicum]MBW6415972.1 glycosyltransferase family 4 protein [Candidatus Methylacidiphilum fumarolicum]TFE67255.1 hypothetical protein A7K73_09340 [Candidatus Methylacidiphilum fumarolicum]TFE71770.1 glycosyltransferase family 1 protein [Candidatus Methylacidiphilum fumarolicum]TFE72750.1 glycosyltransferase family 1 protein [Candidatus Methylacidiphilum fumarolicum]TFE76256.1 hypothetical protein A7D33_10530 [Candidatus Me